MALAACALLLCGAKSCGGNGSAAGEARLERLWVRAGGDPGKADLAACIALAESSGQTHATSANPDGGTNVGLWQLDTNGKGAGYTIAQLEVPITNARATVAGSANGTDWSHWATASSCGA